MLGSVDIVDDTGRHGLVFSTRRANWGMNARTPNSKSGSCEVVPGGGRLGPSCGALPFNEVKEEGLKKLFSALLMVAAGIETSPAA